MNKAKSPKMPEPVRIPQPEDPDVLAARQRRVYEEENNKRGRSSTALSGGGEAFSRTTLG